MPEPIYCLNCNTILSGYQIKFCSRSCAATVNNHKFPKRGPGGNTCKNCKLPIFRPLKYCSQKCMGEDKRKDSYKKLESGKNVGLRIFKRYLIEKNGHQCKICDHFTWMNKPIPLEIDHIDGDITNNNLQNLRILCPNCHAQTDTYKAKNTNSP